MDLLVSVLGWFGEIVKGLGFGGTVTAIVGLVLAGFLLKFFDLADRTLDRVQRRWRCMSTWQKQATVLLVVFAGRETIWQMIPKTPGVVALGLGMWVFWWLQGFVHARRYGMVSTSPRKAWMHHLDVSRSARRHTAAIGDASPKSGGRARRPTPTPTGHTFVAEPNNGQSAAELADEYNQGRMGAATARRFGWDTVKSMSAVEQMDGTVLVNVDSRTVANAADPLEATEWWTP